MDRLNQHFIQRLSSIFQQIEAFKQIEVTVESGMVTLKGGVPNAVAATESVKLSSSIEGVVYVTNQTEADVEVRARLNPAPEKARELARHG